MANFLANAANFLSGGIAGRLGMPGVGRGSDATEMAGFLQDKNALQEAANYNPGFGQRAANLLTGGLYGQASGMNDKLARREIAQMELIDDESLRRAVARARAMEAAQSIGSPPPQDDEMDPTKRRYMPQASIAAAPSNQPVNAGYYRV